MLSFVLNQELIETEAAAGMVLLDFIRETMKLPGTKEACREGECGACTVLIGELRDDGGLRYKACASCILPVGAAAGCHVVTVEGVNRGEEPNAVQQAIIDHNASQCGYCTPGIVLSLTGFALSAETYSYAAAVDALDGNICRCTGYASIRRAAAALAELLKRKIPNRGDRLAALVKLQVLPDYFLSIADRLKELKPSSPDRSEGGVVVAGGTDLFVQQPVELQESLLYFLSGRKDLSYIRQDDDFLRIGAAVTLEDFRNHPLVNRYFPAMKTDVLLHSSTILRNQATLAGNIVNASPIGDITIMLLVLEAVLEIEAPAGSTRRRPLADFYFGYKKYDLNPGEIIREIALPRPGPFDFYNFEKVSNRKMLDIAAVNSALKLELDGEKKIKKILLSAGGVAPIPGLIPGLEKFIGRPPSPETGEEIAAAAMAAVAPIDDVRGAAEYKRLLIGQLVKAHFQTYLS